MSSPRKSARARLGQVVAVGRDLEIVVYRSPEDGTLVVEIDGSDGARGENANGPVMRVYLNDGPIFENPPYRSR
jgi:hypothetical protein